MRLEPQDLGTRWHILLVQERTRGFFSRFTKKERPVPRLGALGRLWQRGLQKGGLEITDEAAAETFPYSSDETLGITYALGATMAALGAGAAAGLTFAVGDPMAGMAALGAGGIGGYVGAITLPQWALRKVHRRALDEDELETALGILSDGPLFQRIAAQILARFGERGPVANDPLERAFLSLVRELLRHEVPANAQDNIRKALRTLGEAIADLPAPREITDNIHELRQRAGGLLSRARDEPDEVVVASLERQAEALLRQAAAEIEANRAARRANVLRQEMAAQIASLRAGVLALDSGGMDEAALMHCAESVEKVAREAVSLARARDEIRRRPTENEPVASNETEETASVVQRYQDVSQAEEELRQFLGRRE